MALSTLLETLDFGSNAAITRLFRIEPPILSKETITPCITDSNSECIKLPSRSGRYRGGVEFDFFQHISKLVSSQESLKAFSILT